jgi:uncharacterized protein
MDTGRRQRLLELARWTLERWCQGQPWREGGPGLDAGEDQAVDGLFVTLRSEGELRGCIGTLSREPSLESTLRRVAVEAAGSDPRFPPVQADELAHLHIGLSLLSPALALEDPQELEIGRDGLIIQQGGRRGLLLPEVAEELGWDRDRFLAEVCRKAFLPETAWRDPASRLYRFTSERWGEEDFREPPAMLGDQGS